LTSLAANENNCVKRAWKFLQVFSNSTSAKALPGSELSCSEIEIVNGARRFQEGFFATAWL
jgi:hypothetical protein